MGSNRHGDLEIAEDMDFQRKSWRVARVGWVVIALIIIAGLVGLLGSGPLSSTQAGGAEAGIQVEHDRFMRVLAPDSMEVHLQPGAASGGNARIIFSGDYIRDLEIERIEPEPDKAEVSPDGVAYTFAVADPDQPGTVVLHFRPERIGRLTGSVGLDGRQPVSLSQLVYP